MTQTRFTCTLTQADEPKCQSYADPGMARRVYVSAPPAPSVTVPAG
jgi:hypothetical protein